jgi:hypothetical protein
VIVEKGSVLTIDTIAGEACREGRRKKEECRMKKGGGAEKGSELTVDV